jgi:hypothetical protein
MSRRRIIACFSTAVAACLLAGAFRAAAADLPPPDLPVKATAPVVAPEPLSPFYVGGGIGVVHHTGYLPQQSLATQNTPEGFNVKRYALGDKVFAGYEVYDWLRLEGAFHYLGSANFFSIFDKPGVVGAFSMNTEKSYALAGSVLFVARPLASWSVPWFAPTDLLFRVGAASKDIHQTGAAGDFEERTLAAVLGVAAEWQLSPHWSARLEYEYLSTAIGGPHDSVSAFRGLFHLNIGGTQNVVNVMHTPLSLSVAYRF